MTSRITSGSIDFAYDRRGTGAPLVLLHGIGHRWQAWEPVFDLLAEHHDVIAVDLPGFGASGPFPTDQDYTVDTTMVVFSQFFADLGIERPHVAGNSLGGMLSLELASRGLVSTATALSPAGFWTAAGRVWALQSLTMLRRMARAPRGVVQLAVNRRLVRSPLAGLIFGDPTRVPAEVLLADMIAMGTATGFERLTHVGRDYAFASPAPTVPTTVAWGARDRILWPSQARIAAQRLPAARHVRLDRCGHVPMSDDPHQVAELILSTCALSTVDGTRAA